MYLLPYYEPILDLILGMMHNWLEGVLQHQLRELWGIGRKEKKDSGSGDEEVKDSNISDSADELEELHQEAQEHQKSLERTAQSSSDSDSDNGTPTPRGSPAPMEQDLDNGQGQDDDDDDFIGVNIGSQFNFTKAQLTKIHECLAEVSLPTWVGRPPTNLGEKGHGKLKAYEYLILFSVILPLIIPELWYGHNDATEDQLLESYYQLTAATHIIISYTISNSEAEQFTSHYVRYRKSIQHLYAAVPSMPNHHMAMHNELLLKHWGPLTSLAEFSGEQINGIFQKVKTNRHLCMLLYLYLLHNF